MRCSADGQGKDAPEATESLHQLSSGGNRNQTVRYRYRPFPSVNLLDDSDVCADMGTNQCVIKHILGSLLETTTTNYYDARLILKT